MGQCIVLSGDSVAGMESVTHLTMQQSENTGQLPNAVSMSGQRRKMCVNIETASDGCHVFAQSSRLSDGLVLGQRRRRLTGIESAMGYDAGPTLNRNLVGRLTCSVRGTSYSSINVGQHRRWW